MVYVEATDWVLCEVGTELEFITYLKLLSKFCYTYNEKKPGNLQTDECSFRYCGSIG